MIHKGVPWFNMSPRADSNFAPSQREEAALLYNDASHWQGASIESALSFVQIKLEMQNMNSESRSLLDPGRLEECVIFGLQLESRIKKSTH